MMKLLRGYFWWTYERGSLHYDVMVTLILLFIFGSPFFIDYKATPVTTVATHASEVLVSEAGSRGSRSRFVYQVRTEDMGETKTDAERQQAMLRVMEPISGEVAIEKYEPVMDPAGRVVAYNVWVLR